MTLKPGQHLKRMDSRHSCATTATPSTLSTNNSTTKALRNLIYLEEWTDVISICISNPYEAKVTDRVGDLPLHEACLHGAPFEVIKGLLLAHPCGIKKKGFCGRLPLHYAVYNKPSLDTVNYLLKKYPEGASTDDADGRLPIHLAVIRNAPREFIEALIVAYPNSLRVPNKFGNTPEMLARNNYICSVLSGKKDSNRTALRRIYLKKNPSGSYNSKQDANALRKVIKKTKRDKMDNALPINKEKRGARNVAIKGVSAKQSVHPNRRNESLVSKFHCNKDAKISPVFHDDKYVGSLPFDGNHVSRMIQKHETKTTASRRIRQKSNRPTVEATNILCSTVAVT